MTKRLSCARRQARDWILYPSWTRPWLQRIGLDGTDPRAIGTLRMENELYFIIQCLIVGSNRLSAHTHTQSHTVTHTHTHTHIYIYIYIYIYKSESDRWQESTRGGHICVLKTLSFSDRWRLFSGDIEMYILSSVRDTRYVTDGVYCQTTL